MVQNVEVIGLIIEVSVFVKCFRPWKVGRMTLKNPEHDVSISLRPEPGVQNVAITLYA